MRDDKHRGVLRPVQEIVQPLKKLDPAYADWTVTVNYEEIYAQLNHILTIIKFSYFNDDASE
jgi:hypothetical protein